MRKNVPDRSPGLSSTIDTSNDPQFAWVGPFLELHGRFGLEGGDLSDSQERRPRVEEPAGAGRRDRGRGDRNAEITKRLLSLGEACRLGNLLPAAKQTPAADRRGSRAALSPPTRRNGHREPTRR